MALNRRPDTPLAATPEPRFKVVNDSIKPKQSWQQMSVVEKGNKKKELIAKGGIERFQEYKDSISKDATDRVNKQFEKNAAVRGMTVEQLRQSNKKDSKKSDVGVEGLVGEKNTKSAIKSPCKGGASTGCNK